MIQYEGYIKKQEKDTKKLLDLEKIKIPAKVAPTFKGVELGIGDGIIIKSLQDATGKSS